MVGMLCTISYLVMVFCRVPVVYFLKYDPKDVIVTMGGFFLGPLAAFFISVIVSFMEMFSVSDTGLIGFIMNVVSTCSFACTASLIYKKIHNFKGIFSGLLCGSFLMVAVMLLWNYYIVPIYMGIPRKTSAELLVTAFLPFNVLKSGLNMVFALFLYRPLITKYPRTFYVLTMVRLQQYPKTWRLRSSSRA